jgi:diaminopimelate epimerase
MPVQFSKVEACGNDFVLLDARRSPLSGAPALAIRLCDRHRGVGADGLLTIEGDRRGPLMRMFNPDGTEDFCGNGLRCAAAYLAGPGAEEERIVLLSQRGRHEALVRRLGRGAFEVEIELLVPQFDPAAIPVRLPGKTVLRHPLKIAGRTFPISCVSTGTAHTVIFGEADVAESVFQEVSPLLERHALFPERGRARAHPDAHLGARRRRDVELRQRRGRGDGDRPDARLDRRPGRGHDAGRPHDRRMARRRPGADRRPRADCVFRRGAR